MISVREEDLEQLLLLARDKSAASRRALADCVADLFLNGGHTLTDRERFLMTEIMRQLVHDVEISIRRNLAERLAQDATAPRELIVQLAHDTIEVAFPILRRSAVLQDNELVEIIKHRTLEHQLAIAMRGRISGIVSQALVEGGHVDVIRTLLENPDAEIKTATMAYLVDQSKRVDTFQNPLLQRHDLSPELAQRMYWWVSAALRQHIIERFEIDATQLDAAIEDSVNLVAPSRGGPDTSANEQTSSILACKLEKDGSINSRLLIDALRQGEVALFRALFARLTGLHATLVDRLIFEPGGEGMAIASKAVGMSLDDFVTIFRLTRRARSPMAEESHRQAALFFDRVDREAAAYILKGWRRNPSFQRAIWEIEAPVQRRMSASARRV